MAEFIIMPKLGFNMDEGQLVKWHKQEGSTIVKGDVLFEVLTDKTTMEIEATSGGVLRKVLVAEGETIPVTLPIAIVGAENEDIIAMIREAQALLGQGAGKSSEATTEAAVSQAAAAELDGPDKGNLKLSPRAQKYVADNNLDLTGAAIAGSGFAGGVTEQDVVRYAAKITPLAKKMAAAANLDVSAVPGSGLGGKITKSDVQGAISKPEKPQPTNLPGDDREVLHIIDYSGMRKVIGERMAQSKFTSPHLYFTVAVDMTDLAAFRETVNKTQSQKVSFNDFVITAVSKALQKYPEVNCSLCGDKIVQYKDINIGMAVALEKGLIVPVVKQAQNMTLTQIAAATQGLAEKARNGKLMPNEYQGGTFTVSNLGMFGIHNFTAIINPPEAAILSVSAMKKTPVVKQVEGEDQTVIRTVMNMTLTVDHRLIDGFNATIFVTEVQKLLENPLNIVI